MASFARATIVGYLGRDVEMRYTGTGTAVANFSVATTEKFKKDGENQEKTYWWKATVWGKLAEVCNQYLSKGSAVYLCGTPGYEEYTSRDGEKRFTLTLNASEVQFLGKKENGEGNQSESSPSPKAAAHTYQKEPVKRDEKWEDVDTSVPF